MPINPNIALGVQPLQVADPMVRYSQLAGIQNAQNQNALAQYQLGAAQRTEKSQNLLADAYTQSTDPATGIIDYNKLTGLVAAGGGGAQIPAIVKSRREGELAALTQREQQFKVEKSKSDFIAQAKRDTSQNPSDANLTAFKEDLIANPLFTAAEKTQYAANVDRILAMPIDQRRSFMASQGASPGELKPTVQTVNRGGQTDILNSPAFGGAPTVAGTYVDTPLPANVQAQKIDIARQSRPPVQPVAPTITQIVDPANPNQMISVDARRYKGGGVGSPGVIGVGGKEPGAALRTNKVEQGKTQLADDLENLRASFETLNNLRAVPSTERGPLSNVASAVASSRVGQLTGQAFATEAQVERDVINSARSRLVNSIKNATGMSAQQLNSNVELQTMLKSISDPGQSYQSAIRIIQDIEDAYVTGSGMSPKKNKPGAAPAAAPNIDALLKKYE